MTSRPRFRARLILAVLTGALAVAACTGDREPTAAPGTGTTSAPAGTDSSTPTPTPARTAPDEHATCGGFDGTEPRVAYSPDSPPYSGAGLHPIRLLKLTGTDEQPKLPATWEGTPSELYQLVVCQYYDASFTGRTVGTCAYNGTDGETTAEVTSARYLYRVFEARTGRKISRFTLRGSTSAEESCPFSALNPTSFYQRVVSKDLSEKLRPLVEGRAPD